MRLKSDPRIPITAQVIQDYLEGLNRTAQSPLLTADTPKLKARAIANYLRWFERYEIAVHEDAKSHTWKLG